MYNDYARNNFIINENAFKATMGKIIAFIMRIINGIREAIEAMIRRIKDFFKNMKNKFKRRGKKGANNQDDDNGPGEIYGLGYTDSRDVRREKRNRERNKNTGSSSPINMGYDGGSNDGPSVINMGYDAPPVRPTTGADDFNNMNLVWNSDELTRGQGTDISGYRQGTDISGYRQGTDITGYRQGTDITGYRQGTDITGYRASSNINNRGRRSNRLPQNSIPMARVASTTGPRSSGQNSRFVPANRDMSGYSSPVHDRSRSMHSVENRQNRSQAQVARSQAQVARSQAQVSRSQAQVSRSQAQVSQPFVGEITIKIPYKNLKLVKQEIKDILKGPDADFMRSGFDNEDRYRRDPKTNGDEVTVNNNTYMAVLDLLTATDRLLKEIQSDIAQVNAQMTRNNIVIADKTKKRLERANQLIGHSFNTITKSVAKINETFGR